MSYYVKVKQCKSSKRRRRSFSFLFYPLATVHSAIFLVWRYIMSKSPRNHPHLFEQKKQLLLGETTDICLFCIYMPTVPPSPSPCHHHHHPLPLFATPYPYHHHLLLTLTLLPPPFLIVLPSLFKLGVILSQTGTTSDIYPLPLRPIPPTCCTSNHTKVGAVRCPPPPAPR